jgi:hypothetical protein
MKKTLLIFFIVLAISTLVSCPTPGTGPSPSPSPTPPPGAPAAPGNAGINGMSSTCVELRWDDNSNNEDNFIVQRADDAAFTINLTETTLAAGTVIFRDYTGVAAGLTRYYRVLASNGEGRSEASPSFSATPPAEPAYEAGSRIADHTVVNRIRRGLVPVTAIQDAKNRLHIAYGHTSHGSQLMDGMAGLVDFANAGHCDGTYAYSAYLGLFTTNGDGSGGALAVAQDMGDYGSAYGAYDLNQPDYGDFESATRAYLAAHAGVNVVIWSWCGGVSHASEAVITDYLTRMSRLETDYPSVTFVYMTGHLDGSGLDGNLHQRNEQIRAFCRTNNKWLFDFADIETNDPDGVDFRLRCPNDACNYDFNNNETTEQDDSTIAINGDRNWAIDWQNAHTEGVDWYSCGAAHSQPVNANMKAYAAWWLWCRIAGWNGT